MKNAILYIFLIADSSIIVKPAIPYVADFLAHVFWRYDHISTVHFEHGKYHAHYESLEAAKKDSAEKASYPKTTEVNASEHFMQNDDFIISAPPLPNTAFLPYKFILFHPLVSSVYPPPKLKTQPTS